MTRKLILAAGAALLLPLSSQAADVGVSISVSEPGVYGRIDIGRFPQPQVVMAQPVIIQQPRIARPMQPVYLWVPPGHQKKWSKHCREYNACGVPVYFVDDGWYQRNVNHRGGPPGRDRYDDHPGKGKDKDRGKGHGNGKGRD